MLKTKCNSKNATPSSRFIPKYLRFQAIRVHQDLVEEMEMKVCQDHKAHPDHLEHQERQVERAPGVNQVDQQFLRQHYQANKVHQEKRYGFVKYICLEVSNNKRFKGKIRSKTEFNSVFLPT